MPDYQDQCPTEAGTADLGGCPDRDGDGVADKDDACPDEAGTAATNGCPDSDGDGIADKDDKCPDTPAGTEIDADGCPVKVEPVAIDERTSKLLQEKVRFAFGSADLTDQFRLYLDSVAVALNKYPEHTLYINGHTDHVGSEQFNQKLSEQRAQAVKDYLITKGVENPDRLIIQASARQGH
ncbi:OmpA family protein [Pontibacter sp. BAB1700]|uniref:OmpA family protein n=1 Tax=Pontibacter sp. BAB1700 TaxID=1144253 RepID=UPI00026BC13D|nr:OmpA family protein [Pontibacter sp. BAB1700]EJF11086.1 OmpA/MotB domain-containing protein [Pontibacter sp. BAB1700]